MSARSNEDNVLARFDAGEEALSDFDFGYAELHRGFAMHRVYVDFPQWIVDALDNEAARIGITRQSVMKTWIVERIDAMPQKPAKCGQ